jgi:type VI secretion system secreted protein VgrG
MAVSASEEHFSFEISGIALGVEDFTAREEVSLPFEVDLTLVSEDEITFDDVIGKEAALTIAGDESDRYFHGIINEFTQTGTSGRFHLYHSRMVPSMWLLSLEQDCRIFQKKSVPDIVKQVLQDANIASDRFDFRLKGQYKPKEYCVQYRETDLNFISRLLEEEGIFYFFEYAKDKHILVFGDSPVNYQPILGDPKVVFNPEHGMMPGKEAVIKFVLSRQIRSGKVTIKDFNFEKPSLDLTADEQDKENKKLEVYDYPGEYFDEARGKNLAQIRLQRAVMFKDKAEGQSVCPRLIPGFTFKLIDHELETFNQEYLLVEVIHQGSQPQVLEELAGGGSSSYTNQFLGIPSSVTLRPEIHTPKPVVEGVQTAIVTGPAGEEIYPDEYGRVKVQFHWDREGKNDEKSSCWIRVSQLWAGAGWGAMYIPRIGHEVIVDFIEGDPDRPIITGRVYHGTNKPPYNLPGDKTKSTIKSNSSIGGGGSNEFRFEDKKGKEEIYLHGQKDWTIAIENDKNQTVGNNETLSVGNNRDKKVGVNQSETIGSNKTIKVGVNHSETIGSNMTQTVGSNKAETIAIAKALTIGGAYQVSVGAAMNETVGGAKAEEIGAIKSVNVGANSSENVGSNKSVDAGSDISEKAGKNFSIDAGQDVSIQSGKKMSLSAGDDFAVNGQKNGIIEIKDQLTIKVGKASITLNKNGDITINGKDINTKGTGDIVMKANKILGN